MTQKLKNTIGLAVGIFLDVVGLRELFTRPDRDVLVETIDSVVSLHSVYLGVVVCATVIILFFGWELCKDKLPSARFKSKSNFIEHAMSRFISDHIRGPITVDTLTPPTKAVMNELVYVLSDFKIPHPGKAADEFIYWREFLPRLLAASKTGKVKEARLIWHDMLS